MRSWSVTLPAFTLVGHATTVPLIHSGVNPRIQEFIAGLPVEEHTRLKALSNAEPAGLLQVSIDVDPDYAEGTTLTYLHGVATDAGAEVPDDQYAVAVPEGTWARHIAQVVKTSIQLPAGGVAASVRGHRVALSKQAG